MTKKLFLEVLSGKTKGIVTVRNWPGSKEKCPTTLLSMPSPIVEHKELYNG